VSTSEWEPSESESESESLDPNEKIEDDTLNETTHGPGAPGTIWNPSADDVPSYESEDDDESSGVGEMVNGVTSETDVFKDYIKDDELEELTNDDCIIDEVRTRVPETPPPPRSEDMARRPQMDDEELAFLEQTMFHRLPSLFISTNGIVGIIWITPPKWNTNIFARINCSSQSSTTRSISRCALILNFGSGRFWAWFSCCSPETGLGLRRSPTK
jgi:hypothetical protein